MGEMADWILEGGCCQVCGEAMGDGSGDGYPVTCRACQRQDKRDDAVMKARAVKVACPTCKRMVKALGLKDHQRDAHGLATGAGSEGLDERASRGCPDGSAAKTVHPIERANAAMTPAAYLTTLLLAVIYACPIVVNLTGAAKRTG